MTFLSHHFFSSKKIVDFIALLVILIFCLSGILTLSEYGMTWDEGLGNFFFGERYLRYIATSNDNFLNFNEYLSMHKEHPLDLYKSPFRGSPHEFPALADIASATTMYLFSYKLELLDPVDGFHLFPILLVSFFLLIFYFFISKRLGKLVALFSLLFLGLFPRLWGDMHFNVKDVPEMVFFSLALISYWSWFEKPNWTLTFLVGIASGVALGVKANAIFLPIFFILGLWPLNLTNLWSHLKNQFLQYVIMLVIGLMVFFLSWPYLYKNPLNASNYFSYIFSQGGRIGSLTWNWQPSLITIAVIPDIMLFFQLIGIIFSVIQIVRRGGKIYRFTLIWLFLPILRISIPPSVNFDGIRHFIEFLPGAALIAGVGAAYSINFLGKQILKRKIYISFILFFLMMLNAGITFNRFGFFQYIYFNSIAGGLPGGQRKFGQDEATDYWGSSYRQGIKWLNENVEIDSKLYVPVAGHIVNLVESIWLRDDIQVIDHDQFVEIEGNESPVYIMFITRPRFYNQIIEEYLSSGNLEYSLDIDTIPILKIYKK